MQKENNKTTKKERRFPSFS